MKEMGKNVHLLREQKLLREKTELYIKGERMTEMMLMQLITVSTNQSQSSNYMQKILYVSIHE